MSADADLAELALTVAREAGAMLLAGRDSVEPVATKSSDTDLVTQMDRASEQLVRERILAARPGDTILGEEGGEQAAPETGTDAVRWIVDPIDGTVNYFYGLPMWSVSIAAERGGLVRAGVVLAPALDEEYLGIIGEGSWLVRGDARYPLRCSGVTELGETLCSTGFGYVAERREAQAAVVAHLLPRVRDIRRAGSAAIDLCWVAAGRYDAHYERGLAEWDRAAAALIAREAGAAVGGLNGRPESADMTVACAPGIFDALTAELAALRADEGP